MFGYTSKIKVVERIDHMARPLEQAITDALYQDAQAEMMLESVSLEDLENTFLYGCDVLPDMMLEAIKAKANRLESRVKAFAKAMQTNLSPIGITTEGVDIGKPRKSGAVAVQMAKINLSDGQSVSIAFHAPDQDPLKINPDDTLIAFRFLLNSRDVTHVVAPSGGRDISLKQATLALSNLVERNTSKFQAAQASKNEQTQALEDAQKQIEELQADTQAKNDQIDDLDQSLAEAQSRANMLQSQIDTHNELQAELRKQLGRKSGGQATTSEASLSAIKEIDLAGGSPEAETLSALDPSKFEAGSVYEKEKIYDTTTIAKRIRADIAAAKKSGEIPKGMKFSVKTSSSTTSSQISITLKDMPISIPLYNEEYLSAIIEDPAHPMGDLRYSAPVQNLRDYIKALTDQYNFDKSERDTDYYSVNFYGGDLSVDYDFGKERKALEVEAYKAKLASVDLPEQTASFDVETDQPEDTPSDNLHWYGMSLRPYDFSTTPSGVEVVKHIDADEVATKFPKAKQAQYRHGAVAYKEPLSEGDADHYSMIYLNDIGSFDVETLKETAQKQLDKHVIPKLQRIVQDDETNGTRTPLSSSIKAALRKIAKPFRDKNDEPLIGEDGEPITNDDQIGSLDYSEYSEFANTALHELKVGGWKIGEPEQEQPSEDAGKVEIEGIGGISAMPESSARTESLQNPTIKAAMLKGEPEHVYFRQGQFSGDAAEHEELKERGFVRVRFNGGSYGGIYVYQHNASDLILTNKGYEQIQAVVSEKKASFDAAKPPIEPFSNPQQVFEALNPIVEKLKDREEEALLQGDTKAFFTKADAEKIQAIGSRVNATNGTEFADAFAFLDLWAVTLNQVSTSMTITEVIESLLEGKLVDESMLPSAPVNDPVSRLIADLKMYVGMVAQGSWSLKEGKGAVAALASDLEQGHTLKRPLLMANKPSRKQKWFDELAEFYQTASKYDGNAPIIDGVSLNDLNFNLFDGRGDFGEPLAHVAKTKPQRVIDYLRDDHINDPAWNEKAIAAIQDYYMKSAEPVVAEIDETVLQDFLQSEDDQAMFERVTQFTNFNVKLGEQVVSLPNDEAIEVTIEGGEDVARSAYNALSEVNDMLAGALVRKGELEIARVNNKQSDQTYYYGENGSGVIETQDQTVRPSDIINMDVANKYGESVCLVKCGVNTATVVPVVRDGNYQFAIYSQGKEAGVANDFDEIQGLAITEFGLSAEPVGVADNAESENDMSEEQSHIDALTSIRDYTGEATLDKAKEFQAIFNEAYEYIEANDLVAEHESLLNDAFNAYSSLQSKINVTA